MPIFLIGAGDDTSLSVAVKRSDGQRASHCKVTLAVVDEALLARAGYKVHVACHTALYPRVIA